jgi:NAD(P)-dependent dehydrogenase (short-subunit alcohol dehydrogenase family)
MSQTALVMGAGSGMGKATALALQKAGYIVYGTSRNPEAVGSGLSGIRFYKLDLTDESSIEALLASIEPVVAALLGLLVFKETLPLTSLIGIGCILIMIVLLSKGDK